MNLSRAFVAVQITGPDDLYKVKQLSFSVSS